MSVRRRAVKARVERERKRKASDAAFTASLEQLRRDLPVIHLEQKLRAHGVEGDNCNLCDDPYCDGNHPG